jgi:hypothetical protein
MTNKTSYDVPVSACPKCREVLDCALPGGGEPLPGGGPAEGDCTICINCKAILTYGPGMQLASASAEAVMDLYMACPDLPAFLAAIDVAKEKAKNAVDSKR